MLRNVLRTMFARLLWLDLIFLVVTLHGHAVAQVRVYGSQDKDVPIPIVKLPLGTRTGSVLRLLNVFLTQNNLVSWPGLQAQGTFTDVASSYPAIFTATSGNQTRLDVADPLGSRSVRIHGAYGTIQERNGVRHALPAATASLGLLALPNLIEHLSDPGSSLLDGGSVVMDGATLHRITLEMPALPGLVPMSSDDVSVLDMYFDQNMHQLLKSVSYIRIDTRDGAYYLQTTTYSDYREVSGSQIPFLLSQTLNGQIQWTLQLSSISLSPAVEASYFRF